MSGFGGWGGAFRRRGSRGEGARPIRRPRALDQKERKKGIDTHIKTNGGLAFEFIYVHAGPRGTGLSRWRLSVEPKPHDGARSLFDGEQCSAPPRMDGRIRCLRSQMHPFCFCASQVRSDALHDSVSSSAISIIDTMEAREPRDDDDSSFSSRTLDGRPLAHSPAEEQRRKRGHGDLMGMRAVNRSMERPQSPCARRPKWCPCRSVCVLPPSVAAVGYRRVVVWWVRAASTLGAFGPSVASSIRSPKEGSHGTARASKRPGRRNGQGARFDPPRN